jgi:TP901 family phage tail tape measure protein|tara:strand:- start:31886 stop:34213 length:2328 start_codon:yes stop_codon:yes gene_type:complete
MASMVSELIVKLVDMASAPARAIAGQVESLERAQAANSRAMAEARGQMFDAAAMAIAFAKALGEPIRAAMEFESAMADVRKVTDFDDSGLVNFSSGLREMAANDVPLAINELAELAANAAAAGIDDSDLLDFTRMTAEAAVAWGMAGGETGDTLAKIRAALGMTIDETQLYSDAINHLSDNTASKAVDLVRFGSTVAAQGEFFGFSRDQTLAFGSAMIGTGAQAEVAATSFRNMGRALTRGASATTRQKDALKALGLDAAGVARSMQEDAVATTMLVIDRLGQMPEHLQASLITDIFGDEARALAPLLGNLELLRDTLGLVAEETEYAGSVAREFAVRAATTDFALQQWRNRLNEVSMSIGNALLPTLNAVLEVTGPWLLQIAELIQQHEGLVLAIAALVGGLIAMRVATAAARFAMLFFKGGLIEIALFATRAVGAILTLLNPLNLVRGALIALRFAVISTGIGAILVGIAMAGVWIYNNWEPLSAFFSGLWAGFVAAIDPIMPALEPITGWVQGAVSWFTELLGPMDASSTEAYNLGTALGVIAGQNLRGLLDVIGSIPTMFADAVTSAQRWVSSVNDQINQFMVVTLRDWGGDLQSWAAGFFDTGLAIAQAIFDGLVAKFQDILTWFGQWPQMILDAIGTINVGDAIVGLGGGIAEGVGNATSGMAQGIGDAWSGLWAPGRAVGGAVAGGRTYLVGEEGPELFTPGGQGYISTATDTSRMMGGRAAQLAVSAPLIGNLHVTKEADVDAVIAALDRRLRDMLAGLQADIEFAG